MATINLPVFSGLCASCKDAQTAAPEEIPTKQPLQFWPSGGRFAWRLPISRARFRRRFVRLEFEDKSRADPLDLCAPFSLPESTADSSGSTAMICTDGLRDFKDLATPVIGAACANTCHQHIHLPSVSRQISSAVVVRWISGLAGFSNCWGM